MGRTANGAAADGFPLTPPEFAAEMRRIADSGDVLAHADADRLMSQQLRGLGYGTGTSCFDKMERTYA